MSHTDKHVDHV